jgi:hypothetical protein
MKVFLRSLAVLLAVSVCFLAVRRVSAQGSGVSVNQTFCLGATPCVWTYHNDNTRGGVNPNETTFTPSSNFNQLQAVTYTTDGLIYAQPLFIAGLYGSNRTVGACGSPSNSPTNIVFVATENNSVYALEAPPFNPPVTNVCWQVNLNQSGETAIPYTSLPSAGGNPCKNLTPQVGITGTPVIDVTVTPPILYVVTSHQKGSGTNATFFERLHAIDTTTGIELPSSPFDIGQALSPAGFSIIVQNQRPGLALSHPNGSPNLANVYVAWASNCDYNTSGDYDGWVAAFQYNYTTAAFKTLGSFTSEPTGKAYDGGIWMAGSAPAIDSNGNVYVAVANGKVNPPSLTSFEWGNSALKLPYNLGSPNPLQKPLDFYTPNDWLQLDNGTQQGQGVCFESTTSGQCPAGETVALAPDTDMGTGGVVLLNNSQLISVGKEGIVYVLPYNPSSTVNNYMGGLDGPNGGYTGTTGSNPQGTACTTSANPPVSGSIAQCFEAMPIADFIASSDRNGVWGSPAFWATTTQSYLYAIGLHDYMYWYPYNASSSPPFATASPATSDHSFCGPNSTCINPTKPIGGTVSITWNSASGPSSGVAWALDSNNYGSPNLNGGSPAQAAVLRAYSAVPDASHCTGQPPVCAELWDSTELPSYSTLMPGAVKFTMPTVVDGYILVAGGVPSYFGKGSACDPVNFPSCAGQLTILGIPPK